MSKLSQLGTHDPDDVGMRSGGKLIHIVSQAADSYNLPVETAYKLVAFIDLQKIMGRIGGEASSKFGDYLGFLRIADDERMRDFFAARWCDHMVRITVPR